MSPRQVLWAFWFLLWVGSSSALAEPAMRVHFIDVGQGDATLVEFSCGAILIDTGGESSGPFWDRFHSENRLLPYLREFFARRTDLGNRLDALYLTHPHKDHTLNVGVVLDYFRPKNIIHNGRMVGSGKKGQKLARNFAKDHGDVEGHYVLEDLVDPNTGLTNPVIDPISCEDQDPRIRALWGQVRNELGWHSKDINNGNNHSMVLRIDFGGASILFTGDLEEAEDPPHKGGIERLVEKFSASGLLDADVYQVGHHGSHNGTTVALLQAITPKLAVLSSGTPCERNGFTAWRHGHPREIVVQNLESSVTLSRPPFTVFTFTDPKRPLARTVDKAIYGTGWEGHIVLEAKANGWWEVVSTSGQRPCS